MKIKILLTIAAALAVLTRNSFVKADVIILQNGGIKIGKVINKDSDGVDLLQGSNNIRWPASVIKDVRREADEPATNRIPSWVKIISQLSTNEWASDIKQIPATVIDSGILENVPYISFRCSSGGYEINIYGDLEKPACVEIGAVGYNVKRDGAKTNCLGFISNVLALEKDKEFVRLLRGSLKYMKRLDGLTFETTLPDEPDSYGGWWISIYDERGLDGVRASGAELLSITQPKIRPKPVVSAESSTPSANVTQPSNDYWSDSDISMYSRPNRHSNASGMVYVNGYYRANGTYVHGYYRR